MMPIRKSKKVLLYFFLFLVVGTLNNKNLSNLEFPKINKITVSGLSDEENLEVLKNLEFLKKNNLFFLSKLKLEKIIDNYDFIEEFFVFKKYPFSLDVQLQKTKYMAYVNKDNKFFYIGSNRKFIEVFEKSEDLPFIYGELDIDKFFEVKKNIDKSNFEFSQVKNLFYFPSGRWDIETNQGIFIKLPNSKIKESLNLYLELINKEDFQNIKMIDFRQNNQVITNE